MPDGLQQYVKKEITDLLRIIDRDLRDAGGDISADWRFGIAYNAALKHRCVLANICRGIAD